MPSGGAEGENPALSGGAQRGKIKGRAAFSEVRYERKNDEDLYGTATVRHSVIYLNMGNQDLVEG